MKRITALLLSLILVMSSAFISAAAGEENLPAERMLTEASGEEDDTPEAAAPDGKREASAEETAQPEEKPEGPETPGTAEKEPEETEAAQPADEPKGPEDDGQEETPAGEPEAGKQEETPAGGHETDMPEEDVSAGIPDPSQPEETRFTEGYILLKKNAVICSEMNPKKQDGKVAEDAYAWAKLEDDAKKPADSWLSVIFDTKTGREKGEPLRRGYVQAGQTAVLTEKETEELVKKLEKDKNAREYGGYKIPLVVLFGILPDTNAGPDPEAYCTPAVLKIRIGETARFYTTVKNADGEPACQWQFSADGGETWTDLKGETQLMLAFEVTENNKDHQYRCVIHAGGARLTAPVVRLSVEGSIADNGVVSNGKPGIKISPKMCRTTIGSDARFTATVQNPQGDITYQWQYSTNKGKSWKNAAYTGSNTAVMTVRITSAIAKKYSFRCVAVTGGKKLVSKASSVFAVKASASPAAVKVGKKVKFKATAYNYGKKIKYQWYVSKDGGKSWKKYKGKDSKKKTITVKTTRSNIGYQYRCRISASNGKCYTNAVFVKEKPRQLAVVIANSNYMPPNNSLVGVYYDGIAMTNTLRSLDWEVKLVRDTTASGMDSSIRSWFSGSRPEDTCLVYYSGHGITSTGALCGVSGDAYHPATMRNTLLSCTKGKVIVILDSCGSGAGVYANSGSAKEFTNAVMQAFHGYLMSNVAANTGELLHNRFAVLAACEYGATSQEGYIVEKNGSLYQGYGGVFTYSLVRSMGCSYPEGSFGGKFSSDSNGDGKLSLQEAYNGIKNRVSSMNSLLAKYGISGRINQVVQMGGTGGTVLFQK